jgi:hypothetical protein
VHGSLIAEEVAEVYPDLVGRNPKGEPESVHYDPVNAMLLNEFLKEHTVFIKEQPKGEGTRAQDSGASQLAQLRNEVEALVAHAKEQDSRIQKVCVKLGSSVGAQLASVPYTRARVLTPQTTRPPLSRHQIRSEARAPAGFDPAVPAGLRQ